MNEHYLYGKVLLQDGSDAQWYLSEEEIVSGDYVLLTRNGKICLGYVTEIRLCSEAPEEKDRILQKFYNDYKYLEQKPSLDAVVERLLPADPIANDRRRENDRAVLRRRRELISPDEVIDEQTLTNARPFRPAKPNSLTTIILHDIEGVAVAEFRGLSEEVDKVLAYAKKLLGPIEKHFVSPGIYGFTIDFVAKNASKYEFCSILDYGRNLKVVAFLADLRNSRVFAVYSESGYPRLTDYRIVGDCDFYSDTPWIYEHCPTEAEFRETFPFLKCRKTGKVHYKFPFAKQWHDENYVFEKDGVQLQLPKQTT